MYQRWIISSLSILLSIVVAACSNVATSQPQQVATTPTAPQQLAQRVVALTPLSADIIYRLDQNKLVGIAGSSVLNEDSRFQDITSVAQGRTQPNLEKIVALKPDLVIGASGFSDSTLKRLQELKISTLATKIDSWKALEELTTSLAVRIGASPKPLLDKYQQLLGQDTNTNKNTSTLVLVSRQPILTPNKNSWAGDMLNQFQIKNIAADLQGKSPFGGYVTLSPEKILEANPESIILVNTPGSSEQEMIDGFKKETFWQKLEATKNNRVYVFDYLGLVNPGSIDAIEKAAQKLQKVT
ncbi:ABC transporter substrate-binding protein [Dulcicalothrix desertica PCC 7102]|uniref:ABC transporter substrate-binding protein n=1 Tax=Dulcicalothrix desertica PCC 7102 TaxID=232991 RepID=A0A433US29_9CYAN|nr:ABC transporter substrate-binding protein [Dulcicalothrix desertica]RUS96658.1 ABC transporter substrate-binding protein [Dulcicalothrix desertica PCC 7102]TWH54870.1 iron complex transport system substrate-binding protein [Dulcicalothrix desertica PCC 7102]